MHNFYKIVLNIYTILLVKYSLFKHFQIFTKYYHFPKCCVGRTQKKQIKKLKNKKNVKSIYSSLHSESKIGN